MFICISPKGLTDTTITALIPQLSEAEEELRANPKALLRCNESIDLPEGYRGSYIPLDRDITYPYKMLFACCT